MDLILRGPEGPLITNGWIACVLCLCACEEHTSVTHQARVQHVHVHQATCSMTNQGFQSN